MGKAPMPGTAFPIGPIKPDGIKPDGITPTTFKTGDRSATHLPSPVPSISAILIKGRVPGIGGGRGRTAHSDPVAYIQPDQDQINKTCHQLD